MVSPWFNDAMRSVLGPLEDRINAKINQVDVKIDQVNAKIDDVKVGLREAERTTNTVFNHRSPYRGA